jgi:hypothetical protein
VVEQPRVEHGVQDLLGFRVPERVGTSERVAEGVVAEDREHLVELLRCRHHRHVAVGAREDPGGQQGVDRVGRELQWLVAPVLPAEVPAHARGNGAEGLVGRAVDVRARA